MTTLTPVSKEETYKTADVDQVYELVKDALRSSTIQFISIRKDPYNYEQPNSKWDITIGHKHAGH